jgi:hypothetical protein
MNVLLGLKAAQKCLPEDGMPLVVKLLEVIVGNILEVTFVVGHFATGLQKD